MTGTLAEPIVGPMDVYHHWGDIAKKDDGPRAVTIGNFDGVHAGHRRLLVFARERAASMGLGLAVLTFEPHPSRLLRRDVPPMRLASPKRKLELLDDLGVGTVLAQRFDRAFASLEPEAFARDVIADAMAARLVAVGENFRFGPARVGDVDLLRRFGEETGFQVAALEMVTSDGKGVSSSRIRDLLLAGDVELAARLLGRPHEIVGHVVEGAGEGAGLGFPTINLGGIETLVPGPGIYAGRVEIGGDTFAAAAYIGDRPTLGHGATVEAHLLDFDGDLYGKEATLRPTAKIRDEIRFERVADLKKQMARDVEAVRRALEAADG